jgi:predicted lysophospholipase L1 biosynthesis ABC-type transport system permease subunit
LGIPVLAGRDFGGNDLGSDAGSAGERVAIVNDAFARAVFPGFPGESPIGRRIGGDGKRLRIVGVVGTVKSRTIGEAPRPTVYLPVLTDYSAAQSITGVTLVVRTRDADEAYAGPMRDAIRRADPTLAVYDIRTLERHIERARIVPRLAGLLSTVAGGVAFAIALVGVYGVISFAVARRRREIGIRLAIGARPGQMLAMMLWQGLAMTLAGAAIGVLIGLAVTRLLASVLYVIDPRDTLTFAVVPALLTAMALLACLLPARAAARTDPITVLRGE